MPVAATLIDAANLSLQNAQVVFQDPVRSLRTQLIIWTDGLLAAFGGFPSIEQRTVANWAVISRWLSVQIPVALLDQTQFNANEIGILLYRTCSAAADAQTAARITPAQAVAILALYNATWP